MWILCGPCHLCKNDAAAAVMHMGVVERWRPVDRIAEKHFDHCCELLPVRRWALVAHGVQQRC